MSTGALVIAAEHLAREAHRDQRRKFYDAPYIVHPLRCRDRAVQLGLPPYALAAMLLHDVMEDCGIAFDRIAEATDDSVARLVLNLTNPSKRHPDWSRAAKKQMDREHIGQQSRLVRRMKMIDRIDNLQDMIKHHEVTPLVVRQRYVVETRELMKVIGERQEVVGHGTGFQARVTDGYVGGTDPALEREMARTLMLLARINAGAAAETTQKLPQETPA